MNTCFFIGNRNAPKYIKEKLEEAVEMSMVEFGVLHFIVGGYGFFDTMASEAVKKAKTKHPEITLHLLIPYHPAERPTSVPEGFDGTFYPFERPVPHRLAILKANRIMVDKCDCLIAYAAYPGNARNLLEYAQRQSNRIRITDLATFTV